MKRTLCGLILLLCLLNTGLADTAVVVPNVLDPKITGPEKADPGSLVILEATAPEGSVLAWTLDGPEKCFAVDSAKTMAYFACPKKGRYVFFLAVATADGKTVYALKHVLVQGDAPDPGPDPGPDPPIPPDPPTPLGKKQVVFFHESNDVDNLSADQRDMVAGRVIRKKLTELGHSFVGSFDRDAVVTDLVGPLTPWFEKANTVQLPCVALAPIDGGDIVVFPLPKTSAELLKLLEGQK